MPPTLPKEPTPEALEAIRAALYAPLTATPGTPDRLRERAIYKAVVRAVTPEASTAWKVVGSGREEEPTSHTLMVDTKSGILSAAIVLLGDGFTRITVTAEQVPT